MCNYDGGDCCGSCVNKEYCSTCACLDGGSGNGVVNSLIGNGYCDDGLNNAECNYDGQDCCGPSANTDYCTLCICESWNIDVLSENPKCVCNYIGVVP